MTKFDINSTVSNKDYIVFDFDNTLVDSMDYWYRTLTKDIFKHFGIKGDKRIHDLFYVHMKNIDKSQKIVDMYNLDVSAEEMLNVWHSIMENYYLHKVKLIKCVKEFLLKLKAQGKKLYVASATDHELLKRVIKHLDIDLFDFVFSEEILQYPKSQPQCFENLIKSLNTTPDKILFFEDSFDSIKSASSKQIDCIGILTKYNKSHKKDLHNTCLKVIKDYKILNKQIKIR